MDRIHEAFDAGASRYDRQRALVIPDFEGFYEAAVWATGWDGDRPRILDIGAGTGLLGERLLERYPRATLTLMDMSRGMLDVARERFREDPRVRVMVGDYRSDPLGGTYDVIGSALSIHHLEKTEKRELYRRIFDSLNPGGIFVNADEVAGETAWSHRRNMEYWNAFLDRAGLPADEREELRDRRRSYDRMETLSCQLSWLRSIGYADVDVAYKNRPFAVFFGRKRG